MRSDPSLRSAVGVAALVCVSSGMPRVNSSDFPAAEETASRAAEDASPATGGKLALLVGINEYKSDAIANLLGCVNDVHEMKDLLIGKFEFNPQDIQVLVDRDATRDNIVHAFQEHLIARAAAYKQATGKGAIVVFHYSGHGSQAIDDSGDEPDGLDETIVPYDSTRPEEDLLDDQISELLNGLAAITDSVTYIFDSCHSGTATRGQGQPRVVVRDLPEPARIEVEATDAPKQAYALIAGCRSEQRAYEYTDPDGVPHGALTYFLTREIAASNQNEVTYRDIMDKVASAVNGVRPQCPQLSGAQLNNLVFGDAQSLAQPYLRVHLQRDKVLVEAGKAHGMSEGSTLAVYAPGTKTFQEPNEPIAELEVTEVRTLESTAKLLSGGPVPRGARAVIVKQAMRAKPLFVFLDVQAESHEDAVEDRGRMAAIRAAIEADVSLKDSCRLVDTAGEAQLKVAAWQDGTIRVLGRHILSPPVPKAAADAVPRVLAQLKHWTRWYNLKELRNDKSDLRVDFHLDGPDRGQDEDGIRQFHPEDKITFTVTNMSAKPIYFAVLALSSDGSIAQIWPRPGTSEQLPRNSTWTESTNTFLENDQQQSFDYLKLLVFDEPADTFFLTTDAAPRGSAPLLFPFAAAVGKARGLRPVKPDSWFTSRLELKVVRP